MANSIIQQVGAEMTELKEQLTKFKSNVEYLDNAKIHVDTAVKAVNTAEVNFQDKVKELQGTYESLVNLANATSSLLSKIDTIDFPERLANIEEAVKLTVSSLESTKEATIADLQKASETINKADFSGRFTALQKAVTDTISANKLIAELITKQELPERIASFEESINKQTIKAYKEVEKNTKSIATDTAKAIFELNLPFRIEKLDATIAAILNSVQNIQGRLESLWNDIKDQHTKQSQLISKNQESILNRIELLETKLNSHLEQQQTSNYITWALIAVACAISLFIRR